MLDPGAFYQVLQSAGVDYFTGVPDSLLKDFCAYITAYSPRENHLIAANEGNAVALAAGYHLATGKIGLVYMQNSGLGNSVNPLLSLMAKEVYSIPALLLIGWRGELGIPDEPQHLKQGAITLALLDTLNIPYDILPTDNDSARHTIKKMIAQAETEHRVVALVVRKGTFSSFVAAQTDLTMPYPLREEVLDLLVRKMAKDDIVVATTGKTSRELFELREKYGQEHKSDFLTVGSMGHASQIALGIAENAPKRKVYCFDGDGAFIMQLGGAAIIGERSPQNLRHIVLNNGAHESVGGQPTVGFDLDMCGVANACGYKTVLKVESLASLLASFPQISEGKGPVFVEIRVRKGSRKELGRPTTSLLANKNIFMEQFNQ